MSASFGINYLRMDLVLDEFNHELINYPWRVYSTPILKSFAHLEDYLNRLMINLIDKTGVS